MRERERGFRVSVLFGCLGVGADRGMLEEASFTSFQFVTGCVSVRGGCAAFWMSGLGLSWPLAAYWSVRSRRTSRSPSHTSKTLKTVTLKAEDGCPAEAARSHIVCSLHPKDIVGKWKCAKPASNLGATQAPTTSQGKEGLGSVGVTCDLVFRV